MQSYHIWPLVLWKSHCWPLLGTLLVLGKNQFPKACPMVPVWGGRQQRGWSVWQTKASFPSLSPPGTQNCCSGILYHWVRTRYLDLLQWEGRGTNVTLLMHCKPDPSNSSIADNQCYHLNNKTAPLNSCTHFPYETKLLLNHMHPSRSKRHKLWLRGRPSIRCLTKQQCRRCLLMYCGSSLRL